MLIVTYTYKSLINFFIYIYWNIKNMVSSSYFIIVLSFISLLLIGNSIVDAQLTPGYYEQSCPNLLSIVKPIVQSAIDNEPRMGASLLRLHFHDCFVQGCDGSLLLDATPTLQSEKTAPSNINSVRGFEVIDQIKLAVESQCPQIVSCADILAIVARDAVVSLGGPSWHVKLGRRDSTTTNPAAALTNLLPPSANLSTLIFGFKAQGFTTRELVALYGAHTIGKARCTNFRPHINDINIDPTFAKQLQAICPTTVGQGDNTLAPFDANTPNKFDSTYYDGLISKKSILHSDQEFFNGRSTDSLVRQYSTDQGAFFADFAAGMVKMGDMNPLTGSLGQIRRNCRMINY